ncbi:MAG: hypothetical protein QOC72_3943 [Methylobacteriaceae bacterium]|jgi:hypothetical protein|nr:hypothetical protein [Methylobacteriaceae bacterium]
MRRNSYEDPSLLFAEGDFFRLMDSRRQALANEIQSYDSNQLLNTPTDDLVQYFRARFALESPKLRQEDAHVDQQEAQVQVRDHFADFRGGHGGVTISVPGTRVELTIPFEGDPNMFRVRPNTFDSAPPYAIISGSTLIIRVQGRDLTQDRLKQELDNTLNSIKQYLQWQKTNAEEFNRTLDATVRTGIEARKEKLLRAQNLVAGLGFNLKERPDAPKTYSAPEVRRKIEPKMPSASKAAYSPEPVLDEANYTLILDTMDNMAHVHGTQSFGV